MWSKGARNLGEGGSLTCIRSANRDNDSQRSGPAGASECPQINMHFGPAHGTFGTPAEGFRQRIGTGPYAPPELFEPVFFGESTVFRAQSGLLIECSE